MRQGLVFNYDQMTREKVERQRQEASLLSKRSSSVISSTLSPLDLDSCPSTPTETDACYQSMSLDDLDIIKTIGSGTFGRVVLAQELETGEYGALKILSLYDVIRMKQIEHVKNEKNILIQVKHPFIVSLKWHFKDEYNIYFLLDYACGGELFSYLRKAGKFSASTSSFYAAEITAALEYLHGMGIVHRDLKPENLLLNKDGHLKITDFGFAKRMRENSRTWTLCGTPEYLAPEIIQSKGYTKNVDWWALGVLVYEMTAGYSPFFDENKYATYEKILSGKIEWSKGLDIMAKDFIRKLLTHDRQKRLGKGGADEVKRHKFLRDYDWEDLLHRRLTPPIIPKVYCEGDTRNFDNYPDTWRMKSVTDEELELFDDF